jgi:glutathione peroxidase-family protein
VFEGNDPAKVTTGTCRSGGTTGWTFLVDRKGKIVERYEGPVSVKELEQAVHDELHG